MESTLQNRIIIVNLKLLITNFNYFKLCLQVSEQVLKWGVYP